MEENLGERINVNRTREAVATGADQIAVGCPFCRVMLSDGLASEQADGHAREEVEVLDVAQMLLASVKGESATRAPAPVGSPARAPAGRSEETGAEPEPGDDTESSETVTETSDVGPAAAASGSSLFDLGDDDEPVPEAEAAAPAPVEPIENTTPGGGSSLFDLEVDDEPEAVPTPSPAPTPAPASPPEETDLGSGSLFDLGPDDDARRRRARISGSICRRTSSVDRSGRGDPRERIAVRPRRPGGQ